MMPFRMQLNAGGLRCYESTSKSTKWEKKDAEKRDGRMMENDELFENGELPDHETFMKDFLGGKTHRYSATTAMEEEAEEDYQLARAKRGTGRRI